MFFYFCLFITAIAGIKIQKTKSDIYYYSVLFFLFLFTCLRSANIGTDFPVYISEFYREISGIGSYFHENGYKLMYRIAGFFSSNYQVISVFVSTLLFIPLVCLLNKFCKNSYSKFPALFVFILNPYLYIQTSFNILRQACATGFVLMGVVFFLNQNFRAILRYILFIGFVFVASTFHTSSLISLLLIPLSLIKFKKTSWYIFGILSLILSLIPLDKIVNSLILLTRFKYAMTYDASLLNIIPYKILVFIFVLIISSSYDALFKNKTEKFFVDLYLFSLCFLMIALTNDMIYRIRLYFVFISLPAVPLILERISTQNVLNSIGAYHYSLNKIFKICFFSFYVFFYLGYIGLLIINKEPAYYPFSITI